MEKKGILHLKIETILLILAAITIFSTFVCKSREAKKFQYLVKELEFCKDHEQQILNWDDGKRNSYISALITSFAPYTFYNEEVDICLNEYLSYFSKAEISEINDVTSKYIDLYKLLYEQQQQLSFGYLWTLLISFFITIIAFLSIYEKEKIKKNELKILSIINENQAKFSREIHDGIAQDLAALKISIQNKDDDKINYFAEQAFSEVRFLIENNNIELNQNIVSNITDILNSFEHNFGISTELYLASENIKQLSNKHQFELIRILNEALSNVARHSQAKNVIIRITDTIKGFNFIITDDGIGSESF